VGINHRQIPAISQYGVYFKIAQNSAILSRPKLGGFFMLCLPWLAVVYTKVLYELVKRIIKLANISAFSVLCKRTGAASTANHGKQAQPMPRPFVSTAIHMYSNPHVTEAAG
jgi:hypothetical protein